MKKPEQKQPVVEYNEAELRAKIAELQAVVEDLSDHNCAAERMERLKAQKLEIEQLKARVKRLESIIEFGSVTTLAHYESLLTRAADALEERCQYDLVDRPPLIAELRKAAQ